MVFKDFGILLLLLMVSASLAENLNKTVDEPVTKASDKDKRINEIYLEKGLESFCGSGAVGAVHIATEYKSGWFCETGYARNLKGTCVELDKCDSKSFKHNLLSKKNFLFCFSYIEPSCETNEVFLECDNKEATICQDTCDNALTCTETICQRGCFCKNGYSRVNAASGTDRIAKCIPKKCCPPNIGNINLEICSEHCQKYLYGVPGLLCPKYV